MDVIRVRTMSIQACVFHINAHILRQTHAFAIIGGRLSHLRTSSACITYVFRLITHAHGSMLYAYISTRNVHISYKRTHPTPNVCICHNRRAIIALRTHSAYIVFVFSSNYARTCQLMYFIVGCFV